MYRAVIRGGRDGVVVVRERGEGDDAPALRRVRQSRAKRHVALQTTQVEEFTRAVVAAGDEEKTVGGGYQRADGSTVFLEVRDENAAGRPLIAGSARTVPAETRTADEGTVGLSDCRTVGRGRRRRGFAGDEIETLRHRRRQSVRRSASRCAEGEGPRVAPLVGIVAPRSIERRRLPGPLPGGPPMPSLTAARDTREIPGGMNFGVLGPNADDHASAASDPKSSPSPSPG